jgi:hypothetical protein
MTIIIACVLSVLRPASSDLIRRSWEQLFEFEHMVEFKNGSKTLWFKYSLQSIILFINIDVSIKVVFFMRKYALEESACGFSDRQSEF